MKRSKLQKRRVRSDAPLRRRHWHLLSVSTYCTDTPIDKPTEDPEAVGDPYKTLFIARLVGCFLRLLFLEVLLTQKILLTRYRRVRMLPKLI